jgi:hypothetical protein
VSEGVIEDASACGEAIEPTPGNLSRREELELKRGFDLKKSTDSTLVNELSKPKDTGVNGVSQSKTVLDSGVRSQLVDGPRFTGGSGKWLFAEDMTAKGNR